MRRSAIPATVPLSVAAILFLGPVAAGLVGTALPAFGWLPPIGADDLSLAPWRALLAEPGLGRSLMVSLVTGLGSTALAVAASILILATGHERAWLRAVRGALAPLLATPHLASAVGFAFLVAPSGLLIRLLAPLLALDLPPQIATVQDPWGVTLLAGLALRETPFVLFVLLAACEEPGLARQLAAARSLGYGPADAWLRIALPQAYPKIRLPVLAVLVYGLSVVDMAMVLGPTTPPTLAVQLLRWFSDPDLARRLEASAGALLLLLLTLAAIALWRLAEAGAGRLGAGWLRHGPSRRLEGLARPAGAIAAAVTFGVGAAGLVALLLWSLATRWRFPDLLPEHLSLVRLSSGAQGLGRPLLVTAAVGLASAAVGLLAAIAFLHGRDAPAGRGPGRMPALVFVPLLVPQIAFLFGVEVLFLVLRVDGTFPGLLWSHVLFVLPYVLLVLQGPWQRLGTRHADAARTLGHGPLATLLRVKLPLLRAPLAVAAAIGFSVSVAQYVPTVLVGAGRFPTLATETLALAMSGDRRLTAVAALVLMALPLLATALALAAARPPGERQQGRRSTRSTARKARQCPPR